MSDSGGGKSLDTAVIPWIVFGVIVVTLLGGNGVLAKVLERRASRTREGRHERHIPTVLAALGLTLSLLCVLLIPVDIFSVSSDTAHRAFWEGCVRVAYYTLYAAQIGMIFFLLPFVYFFYEEFGERTTLRRRIVGASFYTVLMLVLFALVVVVGLLLFYFRKPSETPQDYEDVVNYILNKNVAEAAMLFCIALATCVGYLIFVTFTAYGMSALPVYVLFGRGGAAKCSARAESARAAETAAARRAERESAAAARRRTAASPARAAWLDFLRRDGRDTSEYEIQEDDDEEDESGGAAADGSGERFFGAAGGSEHGDLLNDADRVAPAKGRGRRRRRGRRDDDDADGARGWQKMLQRMVIPLRLAAALLLVAFGIGMMVSIVLSSLSRLVDSAICGATCGYLLNHPSMFNLLDKVLVLLSAYFPMDYMLLGAIVAYFHMSTIFGVVDLGIRVFCMTLYVVRPFRTKPQGMLILAVISMLGLVAQVCVVLQIAPQYATYGSQVYGPDGASCELSAPVDLCQMTVLASSLNWIALKLPIFGSFFYYINYVFLLCVAIGGALSFTKRFLCAGEQGCCAWAFGLDVNEDSDEDF